MTEFASENPIMKPTFLVGAERSGTTLLRLMLNGHPSISFDSEFEYSVEMISPSGAFPEPKAYAAMLASHRIFLDSGHKIYAELDYPGIVRSFLEQKRERDCKELIGATVHHHFDRLLLIWPEARFLHIVRDPRDVARSTIGMGWAGNVWSGSERWLTAEHLWESMRTTLPHERFLETSYEAIINHSQEELKRICTFLGVCFDQKVFSYAETSTYDLPDPKLVCQWQKKLSEEECSLVESRVGGMLTERGYLPSGAPAVQVDEKWAARLEAQSKTYCRRFRLRRYGLPLYLLNFVSRNLPIDGLRQFCQHRINRIDRANLR